MALPTLDRVLDAVLRVDPSLDIRFISEPGQRWLKLAEPGKVPANFAALLHPDDAGHLRSRLATKPQDFALDVRLSQQGRECWSHVRGYRLAGMEQYVLCILDISPWKGDDSVLRHAAEHDALTGLPNRAFLRRTLDLQTREGSPVFCVALLDLDGFKKVNDNFGHAGGDAVLIETAARLRKCSGADLVARLGGDEFVLVLNGRDAATAQAGMGAVLQAISRPFDTAPHQAYLGASVGIAQFPDHGTEYATLLKNADTAMYRSKHAGKNRCSLFTPEPKSLDFSIKAAMHHGIQEGEFFLEYQPQFDLERRIVGVEALMRWNSRDFGRVPPDTFIGIAEDSGLMPFLGTWALRYACHQLHRFQALMPGFVMSVNVSPVQFDAEDFALQVEQAVQDAGINPATLVLEITESTLMHSQETTGRALSALRDLGIRFSIDDFGTGFSSLAYLTRLPVSSIKIDKSFVQCIENGADGTGADRKLVAAMIHLAHSIDLTVVAEGVESSTQMDYLHQCGCELVQGYLLARPMAADSVMQLLQQREGLVT